MLDIRYIRDNPEKVEEKSRQKGVKVDIAEFIKLDSERLALQRSIEATREKRNAHTEKIKQQGKPTEEQVKQGALIKAELAQAEEHFAGVDKHWQSILKTIPNMPLDEVPVGVSEDENQVAREVGEKPGFGFESKNHWEIAQAKGWIDKERAVKVAGSRFLYIKGDLARLEFALWQFALDQLTDENVINDIVKNSGLKVSAKPFCFVLPPAMAKTKVFEATGRLNKEEQTYQIAEEELWLNASAEHVMAPMYLDEIVEQSEFPIRLLGYTTAFRKEAGTYGKDTEGMIRLHQFNKMEMESFDLPEDSYEEYRFMVAVQEYLMKKLELPYRVVVKCTADIGGPNAAGTDIDVWLPGQGRYLETHTADYIADYQARRMKTRVRRKDGSVELVHNNDATAYSERPLIGIIENNQTENGDVKVPKVLQKFMNGKEII